MKTKLLAIAFCMMVAVGASAAEAKEVNPNVRAAELISRVYEIKELPFDEMSKAERAEVKSELQEIRMELKELKSSKGLDSKVSISVGAIIIILLLIIIL